ncbi:MULTISPECIES: hypothetical protein [unclassified Azospirillum]|uniref:hypothetical protein n=1 Tax=unclassified Azospirillum TaxID=2630922 RepID=UPI000B74F88D|nr:MULTISPECIES: hypothetical protein [unclassified Azospirillum]SNS91251.1 hypothetical protein SAMN05880556_11532 [Azospirillum sp. RU38E]SNT08303.1 hypothetical protein SAMN05880591_11532 [Azospirillum sp. RU37A]
MKAVQIFAFPALCAALTLAGLVLALVMDGGGDAAATLLLLVPPLIAAIANYRFRTLTKGR